MNKIRRGIYPGTFDPVTYGHIDLIRRALEVFDEVTIAVADQTTDKTPLFTLKERVELLRKVTQGLKGVSVEVFEGLVVEFARQKGARAMIRGIRMLSDFEYEFQLALTNRRLDPQVETVFLMPSAEYSYLSSRLLKEAAGLGANVRGLVPPFVAKRLKEKLNGEGQVE